MATTVAVTIPKLGAAAETGFSVTRLREFVTTSLSDSALQVYLDAAMDAIDDVLGPLVCHERIRSCRGDMLPLGREAESITSVVEGWGAATLAADDYELSDSGMVLYRLHTGTNPRHHWQGPVRVTYVREDAAAERVRVAVALVYLDLNNKPGLASEQIGTWQIAYRQDKAYPEARAGLLASLVDNGPGVF